MEENKPIDLKRTLYRSGKKAGYEELPTGAPGKTANYGKHPVMVERGSRKAHRSFMG